MEVGWTGFDGGCGWSLVASSGLKSHHTTISPLCRRDAKLGETIPDQFHRSPAPAGLPPCLDVNTTAPSANVVQSNLTVSAGSVFSFDGARICVQSGGWGARAAPRPCYPTAREGGIVVRVLVIDDERKTSSY